MSNRRAQLGIIFLTILIDMIGFGIVIPVLPLYAEEYGATAVQNGFLIAIFSLAQFLAAPIWGKLSDRVGRKPVLFVSILGTAVGFFLMGAAGALWMLFLARLIDGIAGGNIGTAQAYVADISTPQERARAMGLIGAAFGIGFMIGPAIGGILAAKIGYHSPMYFAGGLAVVNALLVLAILPESLPPERRGIKPRASVFAVLEHSDRRLYLTVTASYFLMTTGFSMMTFVFALFLLHRFQIDAFGTGVLFALVGFIGVLIQGGLIGRLVKRFGEARLATTGGIVLAGSLFALPFAVGWATLLICSAGVAIGNSLLMPTLSSLASRSVNADWQGRGLGLFQSSAALARWVGPAVGGFLLAMDLSHTKEFYARTPLWGGAALVAASVILTLRLPRSMVDRPEGKTANV